MERAPALDTGHGNLGEKQHGQGERNHLRITSYNVCYTKLLRLSPVGVGALHERGDPGLQAKGHERENTRRVITSYSIHYTKLYEFGGGPLGSEFPLPRRKRRRGGVPLRQDPPEEEKPVDRGNTRRPRT